MQAHTWTNVASKDIGKGAEMVFDGNGLVDTVGDKNVHFVALCGHVGHNISPIAPAIVTLATAVKDIVLPDKSTEGKRAIEAERYESARQPRTSWTKVIDKAAAPVIAVGIKIIDQSPIAPVKIIVTTVKDTLFSDKSADEICQDVQKASFKAVLIGCIIGGMIPVIGEVANNRFELSQIPSMAWEMVATGIAGYWVASYASSWYGRIAWGFAKIFKSMLGLRSPGGAAVSGERQGPDR